MFSIPLVLGYFPVPGRNPCVPESEATFRFQVGTHVLSSWRLGLNPPFPREDSCESGQ